MPGGLTSEYTEQMAFVICERIADGESLRTICSDPDMPSKACVFKWLSKYPEFADHYARAREAQADCMFEEIDAVSAEEPGYVTTEYGSHVDTGDVQHRRLRVDALKWMAGKLRPKKYGDTATLQADVTHRHYVARIPTRTTNDPAEWAKQVHAERVASGEIEPDPEPAAEAPPLSLPQRDT